MFLNVPCGPCYPQQKIKQKGTTHHLDLTITQPPFHFDKAVTVRLRMNAHYFKYIYLCLMGDVQRPSQFWMS